MHTGAPIQPCPRCLRSTVLVGYPSGRRWVHLDTSSQKCDDPTWLRDDAVPVVARRKPDPRSSD